MRIARFWTHTYFCLSLFFVIDLVSGEDPVVEAPNVSNVTVIYIGETTLSGTPLYNITAIYADGGNLTFSLVDQIPLAKFALTDRTVVTAGTFDFENISQRIFTLVISVSDGTSSVYANLTISIEDENDEVPIITGDLSATIPENFSIGSPLPEMFIVTHADAGDYINYNLSGVHTSFFQVNSMTGEITTLQHLDYEGGVNVFDQLLLTVTDTLGNSANASLCIYLIDVNDNVPTFNQSASSVSINEASNIGMDIIQLSAVDKDSIFNLSYAIASKDPFGFFVLDDTTNMLKVSKIINLDVPDNHPASYDLVVIAMDGGTPELTGTAYVTVLISQVNEYAPIFGVTLPNSTVEVMSNVTVWTNIAMVTATDANHDPVFYDIAEGNEDSMFLLNPVLGEIYLIKDLDYERRSSYMLLINAIDGGSPSLTGNTKVTITVLHVNTSPVCISSLFSASVSEVARIGDVVAVLNCNDTDLADVLTYSIVWGNTNMAFSVNSTGAVLVNEGLPSKVSTQISVGGLHKARVYNSTNWTAEEQGSQYVSPFTHDGSRSIFQNRKSQRTLGSTILRSVK